MTQIQAIGEEAKGGPVGRFLAFVYGFASYAIFFVTFLYAIGFVSGLMVPKTIDSGAIGPMPEAIIVDLVLMSVFAIQHSVMARRQFKRWWTQFVPKAGRAQHLRVVRQPGAGPVVLAVASDPCRGLGNHQSRDRHGSPGPVVDRLADRINQHIPDQPFRTVRATSGHQQSDRPADAGTAIPRSALLQVGAAPDLPWFHHRVLGRRGHDN